MQDKIEELIEKYLNSDGRLDCGSAFKISIKLNVDIALIGEVASKIGIKISNCELGQFGNLEKDQGNLEIFRKLEPFIDEKRRVFCKEARSVAKDNGLKKVRSTLKEYKIDVKYCELGCFKEKKGKSMIVKTKTWIENSDGELLFGKGKTEVLEMISQTKSIKKAAEVLNMNYKKCWNHLKILQTNIKDELFETKQGGGEGAGTTLKPLAFELINSYKQLQNDIEEFANRRFKELFYKNNKKS